MSAFFVTDYYKKPPARKSRGNARRYQWRVYSATRKKDGLEVSVFVFDKNELEKKLKGSSHKGGPSYEGSIL